MKPAFELEEVGFIRASHITPYGKVTSNWSQTAAGYSWEISVPANSTATIWLPNADTSALTENGKPLKQSEGLQILRQEDRYTVCKIGSGKYNFQIKKNISYGKGRKGLLEDDFICRKPSFPESHAATIVEGRRGIVAAWFGEPKRRIPIVAFGLAARQKQAGQNHKWLRTVYWTKPNTPAGIPY